MSERPDWAFVVIGIVMLTVCTVAVIAYAPMPWYCWLLVVVGWGYLLAELKGARRE